ncbi:unnamed protein product [Didymodactylos carnosus]|uniref:Uncharacterized protein n=1 Tax=Didymodactylos carnosus TaxID=1234261 RepID=A0A8S2DA76_9BILA|nr:unnamed protein product [Didymodactylos carnosus]CAF3667567.1 unnamed protein product [Didymodactylos carnosus]
MLSSSTGVPDDASRQMSAINKRKEQLKRWEESDTNRESYTPKISQRVKFQQAYVFLAACSSSDKDEVEKLIQRGVDINTSNVDGLTALHQACIDNNQLMVEYLLSRGADINCQDNEGWTSLHAAASCGNIEIVKYLLSHGVIVDICNNEGELAVDVAEGDEIAQLLEEDMKRKGIDEEAARHIEHRTMLKHAQDWLNRTPNFRPEQIIHQRTGATALHVACAKGYLDVMDILLKAGANINAMDNDGWTPLHAAAHWDKHDAIKFLIDRNCDLEAKNYAGQTAMDVCDGATHELLKELKEQKIPQPPPPTPMTRASIIDAKDLSPFPDNVFNPWKRKPGATSQRAPLTDVEQKPIQQQQSQNSRYGAPKDQTPTSTRSETFDENFEPSTTAAKQTISSSISSQKNEQLPSSQQQQLAPQNALDALVNLSPNLTPPQQQPQIITTEPVLTSPGIKEKLSNLQRSLHDLSNRYLKTNHDESAVSPLLSPPVQVAAINITSTVPTILTTTTTSTSTSNRLNNQQKPLTNSLSTPTYTERTKRAHEQLVATLSTQPSTTTPLPRPGYLATNKWGTERSAEAPYIRRRSGAGVEAYTSTTITTTPTVSVISSSSANPPVLTTSVSVQPATPTVIPSTSAVTQSSSSALQNEQTSSDPLARRRSNVPPSKDDEAEAQRKHRSAQARRERRSTQSVTVEDIRTAEQQIKNREGLPTSSSDQQNTLNQQKQQQQQQPTKLGLSNLDRTPTVVHTNSINVVGSQAGGSSGSGGEDVLGQNVETDKLQRFIEENKESQRGSRRASGES